MNISSCRAIKVSVLFLALFLGSCSGGGGGGGDEGGGSEDGLGSTTKRTTGTGIRLVHGSLDETPLSLLIDDVLVQSGGYGEIRGFVPVKEGLHVVTVTRKNLTSELLLRTSVNFEKDTEYSVFVSGEFRRDQQKIEVVPDSVARPEAGKSRIRLFNGYTGRDGLKLVCSGGSTQPIVLGRSSDFFDVSTAPQTCQIINDNGSELTAVTIEPANRGEAHVLVTGSESLGLIFVLNYPDLD